jgi:hypothetical protein
MHLIAVTLTSSFALLVPYLGLFCICCAGIYCQHDIFFALTLYVSIFLYDQLETYIVIKNFVADIGTFVLNNCFAQKGVFICLAQMGVFICLAQMGVFICLAQVGVIIFNKCFAQMGVYVFDQYYAELSVLFATTTLVKYVVFCVISQLHFSCMLLVFNIIFLIYLSLFYSYIYCFFTNLFPFLIYDKKDFQLVSSSYLNVPYFIGGGFMYFSYEELQPYFIKNNIQRVNVNNQFKFVRYISKEEYDATYAQINTIFGCIISCANLLPKFTIYELRNVAACHGIVLHSRMRSSDIQSVIHAHICNDCKEYIFLFELIDAGLFVKSKVDNLMAVKKYQAKQVNRYNGLDNIIQEKEYQPYKKLNLKSVQLYQRKKGEIYKLANLESVKLHQQKKGETYKLANLESVKLHQQNKGESYKLANLESVKLHQQNKGESYKLANLESVKLHQQNKGESYKLANLDSVKLYHKKQGEIYKLYNLKIVKAYQEKRNIVSFPPSVPSMKLQHTIISGACKDMHFSQFTESGCAVCGRLTIISKLKKISDINIDLDILISPGVTQRERFYLDDPIADLDGPIIEGDLKHICITCYNSLTKGKVPELALANGKWLGKVPMQLSDLSFAEQILVSRIRHNRCIVKVSSGMHKMRANAICFANPMPKIYDILPPPLAELDEVLAFIYTGPCLPTKSDFERTPLLVRRNKVKLALDWLKLNHCDYYDLEISKRNLDEYPENDIPVVVDYYHSDTNKNPESTAVNDNEEEEGIENGKCPFVVHGLTGEEYSTKTVKTLKAIALKHLTDNNKILAIGHALKPESIYHNPQLFPQMMPWLFPYGFGGIGNVLQKKITCDITHKRHLLMYYDKRFQTDPHFPLIAFNHEQIKQSTSAGYLLAEKSKFNDISKHLMDVDVGVLADLIKRMENGEQVKPDTDEEKLCFQLLKDLDHVGGHVKGSITSKKYMCNEIWSLISFIGAPSWFITFAPADNRHPICLYYADIQENFQPELRDHDERYRLIAHNPVASARFFHFICNIFIKHVLGVKNNHPGYYGETSAYYGTVEQQGRLTLHMHMLLWIRGSLSPQDIRDRILDSTSDFQQKLIEYLEGVHRGEFLTGTMDDVKLEVDKNSSHNTYKDPTQTLPEMIPALCKCQDDKCFDCQCLDMWWNKFNHTVDDLILRSNVHRCGRNKSNGEKNNGKYKPSCMNKYGICKARFPRQIFNETKVDLNTGSLNMKKREAWINTFSPLVTYILRCNTDVTSLLSGTAIKAIVAYISDYITKPGLKTYSIFDTIKNVFNKNSEMLNSSMKHKEKARRLITQIINSLTAKIEIGGPMATLYLLGNPDHYVSHKFVTFYWKNYVREVMKAWKSEEEMDIDKPEKVVVIQERKNKYVGFSSIYDYVYRPNVLTDKTLYEWVQMSERIKKTTYTMDHTDIYSEDELDVIDYENDDLVISKNTNILDNEYLDVIPDELNINKNDLISDVCSDDTSNQFSDNDDGGDGGGETNSKNVYSFLYGHPLYNTHQVKFDAKKKYIVPNFVGGSLPRRNFGDREYYCATMLTLFKPWRNGKDLKEEDYSWDETFMAHQFTTDQIQLMDNFNIRYECNDARDDFSTQLKKGISDNTTFLQWMSSGDDIDQTEINQYGYDDDFCNDEYISDNEYNPNKYSTLGPHGRIITSQMEATENCVKSAGWLDESPDGINIIKTTLLDLDLMQNANMWKTIIKEKRAQVLAERNVNIPSENQYNNNLFMKYNENDVKIVDQSYLSCMFKAKSEHIKKLIDNIVVQFTLNKEQERAFRIVANHSVSLHADQLKMYLGGMGGTGKSQVIKALKYYFENKNESYRFIILGPTGTSAALLGGSTYHSFLAISMNDNSDLCMTIAQVKTRLEGVDYIFIDEVSMIACHEMYRISSHLAKALAVYDLPFGGMNMIFAGDFAQLPPVGGASLYSGGVGTQINSGMKVHHQESAIGKALWHQFTTVVILRENMRQRQQTPEDASLHTALVNMRYGACTTNDVKFLRSRIAGRCPGQPSVASKDFRNVAIICGIHSQKDMINQLGCK